jgi:hypothetical protein
MKKTQMLPLAAMISGLLVGCGGGGGGGGGGGTKPPVYTWDIVELVRVNNPNASCATFYQYEDALDSSLDYSVIGRKATTSFKILFHEQDGSVIPEYTISSSEITSPGQVKIDSALVPEGGYVSLEENSGLNAGDRESYLTAFQKDLLNNAVITVRFSQDASNTCLEGGSFSLLANSRDAKLQAVTPNAGSVVYYHTSSSDTATSGSKEQLNIPVVATNPNNERKLITSFVNDIGVNNYDTINSYGIAQKSDVYFSDVGTGTPTVTMTDTLLSPFNINIATNLSAASDDSYVGVVLDNQLYTWQPIFEQFDGITKSAYAPEDSNLTGWNIKLSLLMDSLSGGWEVDKRLALLGGNIDIEPPTNISDFSSASIVNGQLSTNSFNSNDWVLQRTHVRTQTDEAKAMIQTIYAVSNSSQPMMSSSTETLGDTSLAKVAVNLIMTDENELESGLLLLSQRSIDYHVLSDKDHSIGDHKYDLNGLALDVLEQKTLKVTTSQLESEVVSNSVGW